MTFEWRPLRAGETDHETLWASVALALGVLTICWLRVVEWPPILCPFHAITGLPCPTCGSTRAFFALLDGQPLEALRLNPLFGLSFVLAVPYLIYASVVAVFRLPRLRATVSPRDARIGRAAAWMTLLAGWTFLLVDGR